MVNLWSVALIYRDPVRLKQLKEYQGKDRQISANEDEL